MKMWDFIFGSISSALELSPLCGSSKCEPGRLQNVLQYAFIWIAIQRARLSWDIVWESVLYTSIYYLIFKLLL